VRPSSPTRVPDAVAGPDLARGAEPSSPPIVSVGPSPASVRVELPTPEQVARLPSAQKSVVRAQLLALLAASLTEPVPPSDPALKPEEAEKVLGRGVDWLRRYGPEWHERLIQEFGIGFIMQPVEHGNVLYSLAGLELLKRYWRGERASRPAVASRTA